MNKKFFVLDCSLTMTWCFPDDLPLTTLDKALQKAAHNVGISLFVPD